jgi:hypothetical protein
VNVSLLGNAIILKPEEMASTFSRGTRTGHARKHIFTVNGWIECLQATASNRKAEERYQSLKSFVLHESSFKFEIRLNHTDTIGHPCATFKR